MPQFVGPPGNHGDDQLRNSELVPSNLVIPHEKNHRGLVWVREQPKGIVVLLRRTLSPFHPL